MSPPILVTGGTGRLGRHVVEQFRATGSAVRVLTRHAHESGDGVTYLTGDLRTGDGVGPAVDGVSVIVHCATASKGDAEATRNLISAAAKGGSPHIVFPSIVGLEAMAAWSYPKAKLQAEQEVTGSPLPWTILRATQFYDYILTGARALARLPVVPVPAGFRCQPVDSAEVAARIVELALGEPGGRAPDLAGPEVTDWLTMQRQYLQVTNKHRWVVQVRLPGTKPVRAGALLPPPDTATGHRTWEQFLTASLQPSAA